MSTELLANGRVTLMCGDCTEILLTLPENSVDSIVTDPPYHLTSIVKRFGGDNAAPAKEGKTGAYARASKGFMSCTWDGGNVAFRPETWAAALRVLKPGGHLCAFSGTRTYHRMAYAIEEAGFDIRDSIFELVASDTAVGQFIGSLNDEQISAFFRCLDTSGMGGVLAWIYGSGLPKSHNISKALDKHLGAERTKVRHLNPRNAKSIRGGKDTKGGDRPWLKEAREKGYHELDSDIPVSPEAADWQGYGTALKPAFEPICLARKPLIGTIVKNVLAHGTGALNIGECRVGDDVMNVTKSDGIMKSGNVAMSGGNPAGISAGTVEGRWPANILTDGSKEVVDSFPIENDESSSRYFYTAKADADDRLGSLHPTVKPVDLMQWLVRLVTPKGGTTLDIFAGTGTTGEAAFREGMDAILIEREPEYQADIRRRMSLVLGGPDERRRESIKAGGKTEDAGPLFALLGNQ